MTIKNKMDYNIPTDDLVNYNSQKGAKVDYNDLNGSLDKKNIPEDNLVDITMRNVLLKAYSQLTQKNFLNVKNRLNEFMLLYLNSKQPVDFEKMLEEFSLTESEEE